MKKLSMFLFMMMMLFILAGLAEALTALEDDFDDEMLDPNWNITFSDATGWAYSESGTELTVTDISPLHTAHDVANPVPWAGIDLYRTFTPLSDFVANVDISWTAPNNGAMQWLRIYFYDTEGNIMAKCSYSDRHVGMIGGYYADAGDPIYYLFSYFSGYIAPYSGSVSFRISRVDDYYEIFQNETLVVSNSASIAPLGGVGLYFAYYSYDGSLGTSYFGSESIDRIRIEGTPVDPAPPTANAGPDQTVCEEVTLDGTQSEDTDGTIESYEWLLEHRNNTAFNNTSSGATPTMSSLEEGIYDVTLTVTDNDGLTDTDIMILTVECSNQTPTANAGPNQEVRNNFVTLDGSESYDLDGTVESWDWSLRYNIFDLRIPAFDKATTGENPGVGGLTKGVYSVTLTVTDNDGLTDTDSMTVTNCFISTLK